MFGIGALAFDIRGATMMHEQQGAPVTDRLDRGAPAPLVGLSRRAKLVIAIAVVIVVVALARWLDPSPQAPAWLVSWVEVSGWLYLGIMAALVAGWIVRAVRQRRAMRASADHKAAALGDATPTEGEA